MLSDLLLLGLGIVIVAVISAQVLDAVDPRAPIGTQWAPSLVAPIVVLLADVYTFSIVLPAMHAHWLPVAIGYAALGAMLLVPVRLWRAIRMQTQRDRAQASGPGWRRVGVARQWPWLVAVVSLHACRPSEAASRRPVMPAAAVVAAPCARTIATHVQVDAPAGWATAVDDSLARLVGVQVWDGPPGTQPAVLPTLHRFADSAQVATWMLGAGEWWVTCAYERLPFSLARPVALGVSAVTVPSDLRVRVAGQPAITSISFQ